MREGTENARVDYLEERIEELDYILTSNREFFDHEPKGPEIGRIRDKIDSLDIKILDLEAGIRDKTISAYGPIPDMPFRPRKSSGATHLVMKRSLIEAARNDYTHFAVTTGRQQMKRYGLTEEAGKSFRDKYDRVIPKFLNEFLKKYDQKLVMKDVYRLDEDIDEKVIVQVPSFIMTDKIRKDILRGLPQFNKGGRVSKKQGGKVLNKLKRNCNK